MRRFISVAAPFVVVAVLVTGFGVAAAHPAGAEEAWTRPVSGRVVRGFSTPRTRYGRAHSGVDFAARPNSDVRAAGAGTVVFAGLVAGTRHVVIRHANGWRTSYSFLAEVRVRRAETVRRGAVLGTTGGTGEEHGPGVLHFGLRIGDTYVDPMQLFSPADRLARVHLAPVTGAGAPGGPVFAAEEARGLLIGVVARPAPIVLRLAGEPRGRPDLHPPARMTGGASRYTGVASGPIPAALQSTIRTPVIPRWCRRCFNRSVLARAVDRT